MRSQTGLDFRSLANPRSLGQVLVGPGHHHSWSPFSPSGRPRHARATHPRRLEEVLVGQEPACLVGRTARRLKPRRVGGRLTDVDDLVLQPGKEAKTKRST